MLFLANTSNAQKAASFPYDSAFKFLPGASEKFKSLNKGEIYPINWMDTASIVENEDQHLFDFLLTETDNWPRDSFALPVYSLGGKFSYETYKVYIVNFKSIYVGGRDMTYFLFYDSMNPLKCYSVEMKAHFSGEDTWMETLCTLTDINEDGHPDIVNYEVTFNGYGPKVIVEDEIFRCYLWENGEFVYKENYIKKDKAHRRVYRRIKKMKGIEKSLRN